MLVTKRNDQVMAWFPTTCDNVPPTIAHGRVPCIDYLVHKGF